MQRGDIDRVAQIEASLHPMPWSKRVFLDELRGDARDYFVVEVGGAIVGYAGAFTILDETHITTIGLVHDHRGRGLGNALVAELVVAGRSRGAASMTLEVRASNVAAQQLYRRFGFAPVGIRPGYYATPAPAEDAVIMWVHDIAGAEMDVRLAALCGGEPTR